MHDMALPGEPLEPPRHVLMLLDSTPWIAYNLVILWPEISLSSSKWQIC